MDDSTVIIPSMANKAVAPEPARATPSLQIGGVEEYEILSKIGEGGMGIVYLARDRQLGRYVAIKRLRPEYRADGAVRARFTREGRAAAALNSAHIVHIYAIGEDSEGPFLVMEYVEGSAPTSGKDTARAPQTLDDKVAKNGTYLLRDALELLLKIGRAIESAHAAGFIHRDLKPANILLDINGEPKVADFGIARITRSCASPELSGENAVEGSTTATTDGEVSKFTVTGEKLLSLGYGAPEQEQDASACDARSDVYGLGALLYFALTGKNPRFYREDEVPIPVRHILGHALATDPQKRYQSAKEFDADIVAQLSGSRPQRPTVRLTWRCKWCDTVNSIDKRFCDGCGWDGLVNCLECDAELRFGTPFCGACGANQASYESAQQQLTRIQNAIAGRDPDKAHEFASVITPFEPVGPNGKELARALASAAQLAEAKLERRNKLRELIPTTMHSHAYERAMEYMQELNSISLDSDDEYAELRAELPALVEERDISAAERIAKAHNWSGLTRALRTTSVKSAAGVKRIARLRRKIRNHERIVALSHATLAIVAIASIYILVVPFALVYFKSPTMDTIATPYIQLASRGDRVGNMLRTYARNAGIVNVQDYASIPADLKVLYADYTTTLAKSADEFRRAALLLQVDYRENLVKEIRDAQAHSEAQRAAALEEELHRFQRSPSFPTEPFALSEFVNRTDFLNRENALNRERLANQVKITQQYIEHLKTLSDSAVASGRLRAAAQYDNARTAAQTNPSYLSAKQFLETNTAEK